MTYQNYFEYFNWLAYNEPDLLFRLVVFTNINVSIHESIQHYNSINELILLKNMGYIGSNWMYYPMPASKNIPFLCDGIYSNGMQHVTIQYKYFFNNPLKMYRLSELSTNYRNTDIIQIGTHNTDIYNKQLLVLNNFNELNKSNNNPIYIKDYNYLSSPITDKTKFEINNNLRNYQENFGQMRHQKIMNNYFNGKPIAKASVDIIKLLKK